VEPDGAFALRRPVRGGRNAAFYFPPYLFVFLIYVWGLYHSLIAGGGSFNSLLVFLCAELALFLCFSGNTREIFS